MHALCIIVKSLRVERAHTHTQTYPAFASLIVHVYNSKFTNDVCVCVLSCQTQKGHSDAYDFHGALDRSNLLIDHYRWIIIHYFALTFTHSSQSYCWAQQHYLISLTPLPLPSVDVNIWQLCVCADTDFFSLIKTLEVLIGHYTLFSGPPACPAPLPQTLWSSDRIFRGNNSFPCSQTHTAVLKKQKAHFKTGNTALSALCFEFLPLRFYIWTFPLQLDDLQVTFSELVSVKMRWIIKIIH